MFDRYWVLLIRSIAIVFLLQLIYYNTLQDSDFNSNNGGTNLILTGAMASAGRRRRWSPFHRGRPFVRRHVVRHHYSININASAGAAAGTKETSSTSANIKHSSVQTQYNVYGTVVSNNSSSLYSKMFSDGEEIALSNGFYSNSCPMMESIVRQKVALWIKSDLTLAASLLRLHYHDCIVTGCDGSVLLKDPAGKSTEMHSLHSKGLRGFEVVDDIKHDVEKACPGIVSCADVLATIARDAVLEMGGPYWFVLHGRRDSLNSRIEDVEDSLPRPDSSADRVLEQFSNMGLSFVDLSTLIGAHTVGKTHCFSLMNYSHVKLLAQYNDDAQTAPAAAGSAMNPSMNASYNEFLKKQCNHPWYSVANDPISPYIIDMQYYRNLQTNMGLFKFEQSLFTDNDLTRPMINGFLEQAGTWETQFSVSMVKLGNVGILTDPAKSEIRRVCSVPNSGKI